MHMKSLLVSMLLLFPISTAISATPSSMHEALTPQERTLYREQQHGQNWRALSQEQRCIRKRQLREQWASMSPAARQKLKSQLDAKWNAIPAAQKQRIERRIALRHARRAERRRAPQQSAQRPMRQRRCA